MVIKKSQVRIFRIKNNLYLLKPKTRLDHEIDQNPTYFANGHNGGKL